MLIGSNFRGNSSNYGKQTLRFGCERTENGTKLCQPMQDAQDLLAKPEHMEYLGYKPMDSEEAKRTLLALSDGRAFFSQEKHKDIAEFMKEEATDHPGIFIKTNEIIKSMKG